ncbi:MAG: phage portal protein [Planctomycetota bacterium]
MSLLLDLVGGRAMASVEYGGVTDLRNPALWLTEFVLGRKTASGEHVTPESALGLSIYYACLRNGAEDVAKLPRQLRRARGEKRGSDLVPAHPLARLLKRPNPVMSWGVFAQVMQHRRMGWGNAYAEIVRDGTGAPAELWPVHSGRVRPELKSDGRTLVYHVRGEGNREQPFAPRDMFHLRGMGSGVEGYSVVRFASETLGLGLAAQRHAAAFFGEGLAKRLVAFTKQTLNADAREALRKRIEGDREKNPVGSRRMPIVDVEVDVKDLGIPPEEAQFLEQREFGVEEVARWFRMQLAKVQYFKRAQGWSSLDALNTDYVVDFLTPQVQTWEEEIAAKLLTEDEVAAGLFVRFVLQGLLRGDVSTRIAYYAAGYRDGWLSQNDIRDLEDMNPIEDAAADEYRVQAQMTKLEDAGAKPKDTPAPPPNRPPPEDDEEEDAEAAWRGIRAEAEALRPMLLHTATLLARKETHEVTAAMKRNGENPAALKQWADGFYGRLRERVVEAFQPAGLALDAIAARHPAARVLPADLDAVAERWTSPAMTDMRPGADWSATVDLRAIVLAEFVLDALLVPAPEEDRHAA